MHTEPQVTSIQLGDLSFVPFITADKIALRVKELGQQISKDYQGRRPLIVTILNGSFIFSGDLVRAMDIDCEVQFMKVSSYEGTESTGKLTAVFDTLPDLKGQDLIIIEDIIDQGHTIDYLVKTLSEKNPASVKVASLLFKPEAYKYEHPVDYMGFEIPNDFVVGYGLDYNQMGRNLPAIYTLQKA